MRCSVVSNPKAKMNRVLTRDGPGQPMNFMRRLLILIRKRSIGGFSELEVLLTLIAQV